MNSFVNEDAGVFPASSFFRFQKRVTKEIEPTL